MSLPKQTATSVAGWVHAPNGTPVLRYELETGGKVLHVEWQPGPLMADIKLGFLELARLLREYQCPALLSDSNGFAGDWSELIPWVRYELLPNAVADGLRYLVDVLPADPANSLAVYVWREETRGVLRHEVFSSIDAGRQWIREMLRQDALG